jgi:RNA polymerase sigma-70 factor (ECF subfamily)
MKATIQQSNASTGALPQDATNSDEQLLARYVQTGDPQCFNQLVQRYERELYSYLRRYLGDAEMAEDVFQLSFLQVHLKCQQFESGRSFRPWLYTIATNQAIDAQRRNRRHKMASLDRTGNANGDDVGKLLDLLVSQEASPTAKIGATERHQWLQEAFDELPDTLRDVLQLVYFQNMKYREAAETLGIPVGTVKSRVHGAILKLTEAWNEANSETP